MASYQLELLIAYWGILYLLTHIGIGFLFRKAGISFWKALVPIYSWWVWIQLVGRPKWYLIGMLVPALNILFNFNLLLDLLRSFGRFKFWEQVVGISFPFIYLPIIGNQKQVQFLGASRSEEFKKKFEFHPGVGREWADAIFFALIVAGGMRAKYFDLYQIPTSSMENNLNVGDYLTVSRTSYGMRIPMTPLTIPIFHQSIFNIPIYTDLVQLPYMRLGGYRTLRNNDPIVFNFPGAGDIAVPDNRKYPVDKRSHYIKRCIGLPGDSVLIKNAEIYINGKLLPKIGKSQRRYLLLMKMPINEEFQKAHELLRDIDPPEDEHMIPQSHKGKIYVYSINTFVQNIEKLQKDPAVIAVKALPVLRSPFEYFPNLDSSTANKFGYNWNSENYGPFYLPKRGDKIKLTPGNWLFYQTAIQVYENANIQFDGTTFMENGKAVEYYTFKMGYYWMMGDNRDKSSDSRFWGYVPEDHIVGKPLFTFLSIKKMDLIDEGGYVIEPDKRIGIRWNKIFKSID